LQDERKLENFLFNGDYSSMEEIIRQHEDDLYSLCRKLAGSKQDADDLYQQTWLKAIQKAQSYKEKSFRNWLYTICLNIYRDEFRKAKSRRKVTVDIKDAEVKEYAITSASDGVSAESVAIENYTRSQLVIKVGRLPDKHRLPVILHYFEGMDYTECAKVLKIPIGTIKSRLNSARRKLLEEMENDSID
jgi:RNA polymerase sigma-70 factor (ECF subfamily)